MTHTSIVRPGITRLLAILAISLSCAFAYGQSSEEKAVTETLKQLFKGMENGDSAMASNAFSKEVTLATVKTGKDGQVEISRQTTITPFLKAIGTPHADKWYEEIWNLKITVDGKFAQAWCDFAFYRSNTFSHCGVDAFQLIKGNDGWKIFHLADTRRSTGCEIPLDIQNKHK